MWRSIHRWIVYPIVAVVVMLLAAIPATISASREASTPLNQFAITSFDADYVLQPQADGTTDVLVTEKIIANFENSGVNRGILRAIPLRYQGHRNTVTEIKVTGEVSLHGRTYGSDQTSSGEQPFSSSEENNVLLIRIGDPNRRLAMGRQEWTLSYRLGDVAMNSPDRTKQEIYLDANGTGWVVPFGKVTARLHVPAKLAGRLDGTSACYWGPEGATNRCPISYAESGAETVFTAEAGPLNKRESMTFAVGFTPETFPVAYTPRAELPPWWLFVVPLLGLLIYLPNLVRYVRARHVGRPRVVVTEYLPPRGVPALAAADIIGRPAKGPTAQLLEFIVAGDITLRTDQSAPTRPDGPPKPLSFWEKRKLRRSLRLSSADISAIEDEDLRVLIQGWFGDWGLGQRPDRLTAAEMAARQHTMIAQRGWREWGPEPFGGFFLLYLGLLAIGAVTMIAIAPKTQEFWALIGAVVLGVLLLIAAVHRKPAFGPLTEEGRKVRDHLIGLKQFISMAEADRISWLQGVDSAPRVSADDHEELIKLYEPLLPYAVIFGMEETWTAVLGEHEETIDHPLGALAVAGLGVGLADMVGMLDHGSHHRGFSSYSGSDRMLSITHGIGDGFSSAGESLGDALSAMSRGNNDGGGSRWSGGGGGWSSGGSSGGGRSGGGMGGGGGGGW